MSVPSVCVKLGDRDASGLLSDGPADGLAHLGTPGYQLVYALAEVHSSMVCPGWQTRQDILGMFIPGMRKALTDTPGQGLSRSGYQTLPAQIGPMPAATLLGSVSRAPQLQHTP